MYTHDSPCFNMIRSVASAAAHLVSDATFMVNRVPSREEWAPMLMAGGFTRFPMLRS